MKKFPHFYFNKSHIHHHRRLQYIYNTSTPPPWDHCAWPDKHIIDVDDFADAVPPVLQDRTYTRGSVPSSLRQSLFTMSSHISSTPVSLVDDWLIWLNCRILSCVCCCDKQPFICSDGVWTKKRHSQRVPNNLLCVQMVFDQKNIIHGGFQTTFYMFSCHCFLSPVYSIFIMYCRQINLSARTACWNDIQITSKECSLVHAVPLAPHP